MTVSEFVQGFNNLKKTDLQIDFCKQHLKKTYASIVEKNAVLKNFAEGCVKKSDNGILYLDMVSNKINMTWAIVFIYTDLKLDEVEDKLPNGESHKRQDLLGMYDKFQEYGIIDVFIGLIGEREIDELIMVNKEVLNTWHEEHSSARSFIADLTDKAVRTFVEMAALMRETVTPEEQEKFGETIKKFVGVSNETNS